MRRPGRPDRAGGATSEASADGPARSWWRRFGRWSDVLVIVLLLPYALVTLPLYPFLDDPWRAGWLFVIAVALVGTFLLRRLHRPATLAVMLLLASGQMLIGPEAAFTFADLVLLFAVHGIASRHRWQHSMWAAVAVLLWLVVAAAQLMQLGWINIGQAVAYCALVGWMWTWGTLVRIRREHLASVSDRADQLEREREALAEVAVARERARIAREIHDIVSHGLGVVVVLSEGAAAPVDTAPARARQAMLTVRDTGRTALAEMRHMLGVLREDEPGSQAPQPGIAQLDRLVAESASAGVPVTLSVRGDLADVSTGQHLAAYRIVQEALTNVRRHAESVERVEVRVDHRAGQLEVQVTNDGRAGGGSRDGVDHDRGGHGLVGMRERVSAYDGTLRVGPRPGGGYEVSAVLPTSGER
ncbi:MAG: sensor histidine kinase [Propionibacteriales bacterium]|nr:sensor histidine kinase [Propionibacteriales bacterium]